MIRRLGQIADREVVADYDDLQAVRAFARDVDVVTFEFENVSVAGDRSGGGVRARPSRAAAVLHTTQNRLREKTFLRDQGLPVTPFRPGNVPWAELTDAARRLGLPAVLKTAGFGYDGKGQTNVRARKPTFLPPGSLLTGGDAVVGSSTAPSLVLEAFVDFECELSVVAARGGDGAMVGLSCPSSMSTSITSWT